MVLEYTKEEREREKVLNIMFTCKSMYYNNIVIKIKISQTYLNKDVFTER